MQPSPRHAIALFALTLAGCAGDYGSRAVSDPVADSINTYYFPPSKQASQTAYSPPVSVSRISAYPSSYSEPSVMSGDSNGALLPVAAKGDDPKEEEKKNGKEKENGNGDKKKEPAPYTFVEALCSYLRAVRAHPCSPCNEAQAKDKKNGNGKDDDKKSGNGKDEDKKDDDKKNGNGKDDDEKKKDDDLKWFSAHFQATMVMQNHGPLHSPYSGSFSLFPFPETRTSLTSTLFLDARLWEQDNYSADLVFNPEIAGGKGFSNVNGIAGFTNGEITRVGVPQPTPYFARLFLRQVWGLGGEQEDVEDGVNQVAGKRDTNRFTLQLGKFSFTDVIDNNAYSHDPRSQMLNWSLMYNGAWDYPANVRGYSYGIFAEYNQKDWAIRYAVMVEPVVANGAELDPHFTKALGHALELEERWTVDDHPGKVRLMAYLNHAHMGDYGQATLAQPVNPDVTTTREYRYKYGFGANAEQEVTKELGIWGRVGWSDGHTESWAFTPIDRTIAGGLLLKGRCWRRPNDEVGIGGVLNGLSKDHRQYLAAGGNDFSIGDGKLNYGLEEILEVYYRLSVTKNMFITADFQLVGNPAYNRDRGPVTAEALVVHIEY